MAVQLTKEQEREAVRVYRSHTPLDLEMVRRYASREDVEAFAPTVDPSYIWICPVNGVLGYGALPNGDPRFILKSRKAIPICSECGEQHPFCPAFAIGDKVRIATYSWGSMYYHATGVISNVCIPREHVTIALYDIMLDPQHQYTENREIIHNATAAQLWKV